MVLELAPAERDALLARTARLDAVRVRVEEFGGETSLKLTARPAVLPATMRSAVRALARISKASIAASRFRRRSSGSPRRWRVTRR
jgi:hypothetical protein